MDTHHTPQDTDIDPVEPSEFEDDASAEACRLLECWQEDEATRRYESPDFYR